MMEVNYSTSGFLKDAAYTAHLYGICTPYGDKFESLQKLNVELREVFPQFGIANPKPISFSTDKSTCDIILTFFKYLNSKGKVTGKPEPIDVFTQLRFVLDKAVQEYKALIKTDS